MSLTVVHEVAEDAGDMVEGIAASLARLRATA